VVRRTARTPSRCKSSFLLPLSPLRWVGASHVEAAARGALYRYRGGAELGSLRARIINAAAASRRVQTWHDA
jgi:hypothetical protein